MINVMGMDFVELMVEIEERYAIELDENDYTNMRTFGDLVDMVKRTIDKPLDPPIEESRNEIILQSLLAELRLRLPKEVEINEETRLNKLRPYVKQYDIWSFIQQRFPELPSWLHHEFDGKWWRCLGCLGLLISGFIGFCLIFDCYSKGPLTFRITGVIWFGIGFAWLFWIHLRWPYQTIGDAADIITEKRQELLKRRQKQLKARECSSDDIENELRAYMSKTFALKPEKIQRESDLVKDLRLG